MASDDQRACVEITKWLVEVTREPLAQPAAELEGQARCRPSSREDYLQRLRSFRAWRWFNKPLAVSPIECAKRGWVNSADDAVECDVCQHSLRLTRAEGEGRNWLVDSREVPQAALAEALLTRHSPFCPWRSHVCSTEDTSASDRELNAAVRKRLETLGALEHRPVLVEDFRKLEPLEVLARSGWGHAGKHEGNEQICCSLCLRTVVVQSFQHTPVDKEGTVDEAAINDNATAGEFSSAVAPEHPAAKRQRVSSSQTLPPRQGLYTPRHPRAPPSETAEFDPYVLHHFYCPFFSLPDEDISPLAREVNTARRAPKTEATETTQQPDIISSAEATLMRVDELLRSLGGFLPPA